MDGITFTLDVPVRSYIKKYVLWHYDYVEPVPMSRKHFPGVILLNQLERPANYDSHELSRADARITFSLPEYLSHYHGVELSRKGVFAFHNVMDALFRQELFSVYFGISVGDPTAGAIKKAIDLIIAKYQIEEHEFSYENFRKTIYRERKKRNQNKVKRIFKAIVP